MLMHNWTYAKGSLVGFLIGFALFLLINPALTLAYHDQFRLLFGCIATCVAIGCAAVTMVNRQLEREAGTQHRPSRL